MFGGRTQGIVIIITVLLYYTTHSVYHIRSTEIRNIFRDHINFGVLWRDLYA